jgi:hypothetical protein
MNETNGILAIANERQRQIDDEGYTVSDDARHYPIGELAMAAACYAVPNFPFLRSKSQNGTPTFTVAWPWSCEAWKPSPDDRIKELSKAGALIAAEIDRLLAEAKKLNPSGSTSSDSSAPVSDPQVDTQNWVNLFDLKDYGEDVKIEAGDVAIYKSGPRVAKSCDAGKSLEEFADPEGIRPVYRYTGSFCRKIQEVATVKKDDDNGKSTREVVFNYIIDLDCSVNASGVVPEYEGDGMVLGVSYSDAAIRALKKDHAVEKRCVGGHPAVLVKMRGTDNWKKYYGLIQSTVEYSVTASVE